MRCRPLATDGGASIWTTRSIAPMSMPSSSDEVATSAAQRGPPSARPRSRRAAARASEPWCARTSVSPASSFSAPASRSARRRLLTKISVERCARISSSSRGWIADQIDGARRALRRPGRSGCRSASSSRAMSSTGTSIVSSQRLLRAGVDDGDGRGTSTRAVGAGELVARSRSAASAGASRVGVRARAAPAVGASALRRRRETAPPRRAAAASPTGRCAAAAARHSASSRSSDSARCAPRLVGTSAWISSMMTVSTAAQRLARVRGQQQVERLRRGDEDVGRLALEARALGWPACRRCGSAIAGATNRVAARAPRPARCRRAARAGCARRRPPAP